MAKNDKKDTVDPRDEMLDSLASSMGMLGRIFGIDLDSEKEYKEKLNKMTKEQLINEIIVKDAELKKSLRDRANDNEIAKAIKEGMQSVAFAQQQSGITISADKANAYTLSSVSDLRNNIEDEMDNEKKRMADAYELMKAIRNFEDKDIVPDFKLDLDVRSINPFKLNSETIKQMSNAIEDALYKQSIYDLGWNDAYKTANEKGLKKLKRR